MLYTLAGGGALCGVASLVLLIVATATDFWMQYRYSGSSANQGLWRFCINRKCHSHTITVAFWDATRAFMLLSMLSCLTGVILGLSAFTNRAKNKRVKAGGIALLLSGEDGERAREALSGVVKTQIRRCSVLHCCTRIINTELSYALRYLPLLSVSLFLRVPGSPSPLYLHRCYG
ncbi:UNVERIFIED_CONTAM: hypothetical protein FKN15_021191 [Acipenser sinensis]